MAFEAYTFQLAGRIGPDVGIALAQAVDAVQSRHRAPAEFALVLLAASGATWLARRRLRITTMAGAEA